MKGPGFSSGLCLMLEVLNKSEVEYLGPLLVERLKVLQRNAHVFRADCKDESVLEMRQEIKTLEKILSKIDYPFRS